jgi:hypothetical protein
MLELALLGAQASLDIAQTLEVGQLREGHAQKLIEAGERLDLVVAVVAPDTPSKGVHRHLVDHLRENEFARIHVPEFSAHESVGRTRAE